MKRVIHKKKVKKYARIKQRKKMQSRKKLEKRACGFFICLIFVEYFPRCTLAHSNIMNHDYSHQVGDTNSFIIPSKSSIFGCIKIYPDSISIILSRTYQHFNLSKLIYRLPTLNFFGFIWNVTNSYHIVYETHTHAKRNLIRF